MAGLAVGVGRAAAPKKPKTRRQRGSAMRALAIVLLILFAGCLGPSDAADGPAPVPALPDEGLLAHLQTLAMSPEMRFHTDHGEIRMLLYTEWLPTTTGHIGGLVDADFYDGTIIHRVVDDFVIQGGDKTGTGEGGSGPLGTSNSIPLEIKDGLQFGSGAVGLARWTEDTGDSQWFITEKPALHLDDPQGTTGQVFGAYSLFAQVFEGMEVVRHIAAVETIPQADRPIEDVLLQHAELLPSPTDADLINLVPDVIAPFDLWGARNAELEVPRFAVAGHPMLIRVHAPPPQAAAGGNLPCDPAVAEGNHGGIEGSGPEGFAEIVFAATADPCTFEAHVIPSAAGNWTFVGTDSLLAAATAHTVQVLAWHDAYRPFAGTSAD